MSTLIDLGFRPTLEGVREQILSLCKTVSKTTSIEIICDDVEDMRLIFKVMEEYHGKTMEGKDAIPFFFEDGGIWRPTSEDPNKDKVWTTVQTMNFTRAW